MKADDFIKLTFRRMALLALSLHFAASYAQGYGEKEIICCEPRVLDFDTAVRRTFDQSLVLSQDWNEAQARRGLVKQASLYPNPAFSYDLQTSQFGWRERQDIYAISQLIELGGKRQKQTKAATYEYYAALTDYEISKLERLNHLSKAFIRVVAAQERAQLAMQHQANAQQTLQLISIKREGGKASLIQQNKAKVASSLAEINLKKAIAEFRTAKNSLALLWSSSCPDFDTVIYPFFDILEPPPLEEYLARLCDQPEIAKSLYKYMAAYHQLRVEKAVRVPDVTVTLGYGYNQGDKGVVAGVAVPLPIWDRIQGNIQRAYYEMLKTEDEGNQLRLFLKTKLSNAYLELTRSYLEVEDLRNLALEASNHTLALAHEGYREGKMEYWEVLNAQQILIEVQEKYIDALVHYHNKRAEIDYLTSSQ
jgi:cobalt-zinc-cadmium efflux system outer membrane protein